MSSSAAVVVLGTLVLLAVAGCELVPRSAYRKLAAYQPRDLIRFDPGAMRLAILHDARARLALDHARLELTAAPAGASPERALIHPRLIVESPTAPGLPAAGNGKIWTVLALRVEDQSIVRPLGFLFFSQLMRKSIRAEKREPTASERAAMALEKEERNVFRSGVEKVMPALAARAFEESPDATPMDLQFTFAFASAAAVDPEDFPIEARILIAPADGYFLLLKGAIDLPGFERPRDQGPPENPFAISHLASKDPSEFRMAIEHDAGVAVDASRTALVIQIAAENGPRFELRRFRPAVLSKSRSLPGLPPAEPGLAWSLLALHPEDVERLRALLRLLHEISLRGDPTTAEEGARRDEEFRTGLRKIFPDAAAAIGRASPSLELSGLETDTSLEFTRPLSDGARAIPYKACLMLDPDDGYVATYKGEFVPESPR